MDVAHFTHDRKGFPPRKCGVLGATGSVGQRFILLLANHPHFTLTTIGASERSAGKRYREVVRWKQALPMSKELGDLVIQKCVPEAFRDCEIVFSGLDIDVAGDIEMEFLMANLRVFSNAKNHRMNPLVPLVAPTVNINHLDIIAHQRKHYNLDKGLLVTNSNCAVIALVIPFAALQAAYRTLFHCYNASRIRSRVSRFAVLDGHLACVDVKFQSKPAPTVEEVNGALRSYVSEAQKMQCPSAPQNAIVVMEEQDRPQPRLDRETDRGYAVSIGRIREDASGIWDLKFVALSHNTIIGAAGASLLKRSGGSQRLSIGQII
ncbi:hypothetical protein MMC13_002551 [Lambiella insularis]|nr:hypothetical protein [Lambiella insularis]